ncbi:hypothetical protein JRQ81_007917 [Phrynocephalus forsythii]|uniref:P-selectin glycoprotein ligand 1 n=1 Tax=Phrynocephalus forsythii TaxID=171643 RepID=A0A9Q1ATV1_9SAUR|nr:hypothetical protein JRQ81_007917 [Phrynocephalus forsythii]
MAPAWLSFLTFSLPLLVAGGSKPPAGISLAQEGAPRKDVGTQGPAGQGGSALPEPQKWEWKAGRELPLASRRKRDGSAMSKKDTGGASTSLGSPSNTNVATPSPDATITPASGRKASPGGEVAASKDVTHLKTPKETASFPPPKTSGDTSKATSTGAKGAEDAGRHFVPKGIPAATQNSPGKENLPLSPMEAGNVSTTTEYWPWLEDRTSDTPQVVTEDTEVSTSAQWLEGKKRGKNVLPFKMTAMSPTTGWPWMRGLSSASSLTLVDNLELSTATLEEETETHQPVPSAKGKSGFSDRKPATTSWPWLDEMSTPSSQTLVVEEDISTATPQQTSATEKMPRKGKGMADSSSRITTVAGATAATSTTSLVNLPPAVSPRGAPDLLGKCLLAISLLALVAAIFIVTTTVLAVVLWRRARASKENAHSHTEMVCISSLLAAEEAEEAQQKQPQVKRAKMLGESNGLEAEMDNLTLNSFLPEH